MSRFRGIAAALTVVLAAAGGLVTSTPSASAGRPARMQVAPSVPGPVNPHQSESSFASVSCHTSSFCMAVGSYLREDTEQTLAERWNGSKWSITGSVDVLAAGEPISQRLTGVSCPSNGFCMAVGSTNSGAIAETWSGSRWTLTSLPVLSGAQLSGISCPTSTVCAAVGEYTPASAEAALVLYWSPAGWTLGTGSNQGTGNNVLTAVSCPNSGYCMAVGYYADSVTGLLEPLAEWDMAATWHLANPALNASGANNYLRGVSCTSDSLCMAVGDSNLLSQDRNLSFTWNGTAWSRRSVVQPGTAVDRLEALRCPVAVNSTTLHCVAVGEDTSDSSTTYKTQILSWNGTRWTQRPSPSAQPYQNLDGLGCASPSSCVAVGDESDSQNQVALADSFNGTSWARDSVKDPVALTQFLSGTSCTSPSFCMAVGQYGNGYVDPTLAQVWNGAKWTTSNPIPVATGSDLLGVSCVSKPFCVAVGYANFGLILLDGPASRPASPGAAPGIRSVPGIVSGGEDGLVEVWNGHRWTATLVGLSAASEEILTGVSCSSAKFCMAVGNDGFESELVSYVWRGASWARFPMPSVSGSGESPNSVSCTGPSNCVTVGGAADFRRAFAEHWNGKRWSVMSLANPVKPFDSLNGVDCPSPTRCIAVGGDWSNVNNPVPQVNLAESWNGSKWTLMAAPTSVYSVGGLAAVSCHSTSSCLAVGPGNTQLSQRGIVLRLANSHWGSVTLPTPALGEVDLESVSETSSNSAVVVGYSRDKYGFSRFTLIESRGHWAVK